MKSSARLALALAALAALVATPASSSAKLPPGTAFEACGASGCETASGDEGSEVLRLQLKLIEPTMESGAAIPPSGTHAWVRVDVDLPPVRGADFRALERRFPVLFASDAGYLGVPRKGGYRWVSLRASQIDAYAQLGEGVRPFSPATLAKLDPATVARAKPTSPVASTAGGDESDATPTWLIASLAVAGSLAGFGLVLRARRATRRAHRPAQDTPA